MMLSRKLSIGDVVEAERDDGDGYEQCTVKSIGNNVITLMFEGGFLRENVPLTKVKLQDSGNIADASSAIDRDDSYDKEVGALLPQIPGKITLEQDPDAKYAYILAYKDVGNTLFKAGKYAWAIKTYVAAVDSLAISCYESREYMLWDYFARGPCGQCYSNAALCALKLGSNKQAASLCGLAMECKPEDADLVKVLLRYGQALLALDRPGDAKQFLAQAAEKDPANRSVREELVRAKKAAAAAAKEADKQLFHSIDLSKQGLTSKKEVEALEMQHAVDMGFAALVHRMNSLLPMRSCDSDRMVPSILKRR